MGKIIGTCGHEVTNTGESGLGFPIAVKDMDREGNHCTSYCVVCAKCLQWYKKRTC